MRLSPDPLYPSRRSPVLAENVVAASQPLAAQAGLSMLAQGGNAVDAALATAIALTVLEPTGNGIGSDAFCILWDGSALHGLNASGRSPMAWRPDRFAGRAAMPFRGWEAVTVPGAVSAWVALSARFGRLPFEALFAPAVRYAESGYAVTPAIAALWAKAAPELAGQPGFAETFLPGGRPPRAGERFACPAMAATLREIAETRGESFYRGRLAARIAAAARAGGAALVAADLEAHTADWVEPIAQDFDGVTLREIPPNGQGIVACMALGVLAHTPIRDLAPDDPLALHLQIEAVKLALRDAEAYVADPAHMTEVMAAHLLDPDYLARRARLIDLDRATDFGAGAPRHGGTVCLAAADASGMMVSYIQSNYAGFGSGVVVPGTGVSLQNRGAGFTPAPGHPNGAGPGKRPFHTIIPGFLMQGDAPLAAFGVMGGSIQAQGHAQISLRMELWGQDPQTAADAPRWRVGDGLSVAVEPTIAPETRAALAAMGHGVSTDGPDAAFGFGGAQIVRRLGAGYAAGSDPRKDGCAVGF
ncbi:MAG: gamma-glutamyltransferase family protein [Rhodobacteraceae bacterium]|nr:MAG: gamma-glutamyltransferase family protein [Paracoccaceae bacterium]